MHRGQDPPQIIWDKIIFDNFDRYIEINDMIEADNGDFVLTGVYSSHYIIVFRINPLGVYCALLSTHKLIYL